MKISQRAFTVYVSIILSLLALAVVLGILSFWFDTGGYGAGCMILVGLMALDPVQIKEGETS